MQLTRDSSVVNFIRAWEPGRVRIAERWIAGNVIVGPDQVLEGWTTVEPHVLTLEHLEPALALEPTIIVVACVTSGRKAVSTFDVFTRTRSTIRPESTSLRESHSRTNARRSDCGSFSPFSA